LISGCATARASSAYQASIRQLLFSEQVLREQQQQAMPWRLDAGACRRLLNAVPTDALASAYLTSREQWCMAHRRAP
jgi:hypothetical protein